MISFIKKNKIFSCLLIFSIFTFFFSIFVTSVFPENIKSDIHESIIQFLSNQTLKNKSTSFSFLSIWFDHMIPICLIWLFGISVIGIVFIVVFYCLKIILFAWNFIFLIMNIKSSNFLFILLYLLPAFFYLIILFFASFYAISYSLFLIRFILQKKEISFHKITKNYFILFLFLIVMILFLSIFELFLFSFFS